MEGDRIPSRKQAADCDEGFYLAQIPDIPH
jgi:hypothetical protein